MSEKKTGVAFDVTVLNDQIFLVKTWELDKNTKDAELERLEQKAAYELGGALIRAWAEARGVSPEPALQMIEAQAAASVHDTQEIDMELKFSRERRG